MDEFESLNHSKWERKYHVVFGGDVIDSNSRFTYSKLVAQSACARLSDWAVNAENPTGLNLRQPHANSIL